MRTEFANELHQAMKSDSRVFLLIGDVGFGILDTIRKDFPTRAINVGSSEQLLIGAGVGLALQGMIPVCYSITPFLILRPFEFIRNYLEEEGIGVKLVGSGRDDDYKEAGYTHHAQDIPQIISAFSKIKQYYPSTQQDLILQFNEFLYSDSPAFLSLSR